MMMTMMMMMMMMMMITMGDYDDDNDDNDDDVDDYYHDDAYNRDADNNDNGETMFSDDVLNCWLDQVTPMIMGASYKTLTVSAAAPYTISVTGVTGLAGTQATAKV